MVMTGVAPTSAVKASGSACRGAAAAGPRAPAGDALSHWPRSPDRSGWRTASASAVKVFPTPLKPYFRG